MFPKAKYLTTFEDDKTDRTICKKSYFSNKTELIIIL